MAVGVKDNSYAGSQLYKEQLQVSSGVNTIWPNGGNFGNFPPVTHARTQIYFMNVTTPSYLT